jgi:hypothetical protein
MKRNTLFIAIALGAAALTGCRKYLDVNSDPASPQSPNLAALMPPVTAVMSRTMVFDGRFVGAYTQNWSNTAASEIYDLHGGNAGGSGANQLWRDFYTVQGTAINLMIRKGILEEKWDYVGAAIALRAWGLLSTTQYFGEMPYYQAWEPNRVYFVYDRQEVLYRAVDSLCRLAISYLDRTDGKVSQVDMSRGDQVYQGNRDRWRRFTWGVLARAHQSLSNKPEYNADSVIAFVDRSFQSNADNFNIVHSASRNDDTNPLGPARDNFSVRRQSRFIVQLLDGATLVGNTLPTSRDPRIRGMLSVSPDTTTVTTNMPSVNGGYRFLIPGSGYTIGTVGSAAFRQAPSTPWGDSAITNPGINNFGATTGKYLFKNNAPFPIMTYFELQFIKSEAAFRKGDRGTAFQAYRNGIRTHFDYVNTMNASTPGFIAITPAQRDAYLNGPAVKQDGGSLTISDIMLQKYIADWGWNYINSWSDMRRFHYFDLDTDTGTPVYRNYQLTLFSSNNLGPKPAYRFRPTNFSEFDWNLDELRKIGALNVDYHTYEMWFSQN